MAHELDYNKFYEAVNGAYIDVGDLHDLFIEAVENCLYYEGDASDRVDEFINNDFIYDCDKWAIMQHYQRPTDADYNEAENCFIDELTEVLSEYLKLTKEQDEDEDEDD